MPESNDENGGKNRTQKILETDDKEKPIHKKVLITIEEERRGKFLPFR